MFDDKDKKKDDTLPIALKGFSWGSTTVEWEDEAANLVNNLKNQFSNQNINNKNNK